MITVNSEKILMSAEVKVVDFWGCTCIVPEWVNFMTVNIDGTVKGFNWKPTVAKWYGSDDESSWINGGDEESFGMIEFTGDWKESLVEV